MSDEVLCPLCERSMPEGTYNEHHLIPKTYKGKEVVLLHFICHDKIHHTFSEQDLAQYYHTIDRLREHEQIKKFVKWVAKQPPEFYDKHKDTKERRKKRKKK